MKVIIIGSFLWKIYWIYCWSNFTSLSICELRPL